ncbi:hypothetical protein AKJ66_04545 [candidate division MSBL1 archaeon SCGC-AAA259E22]|uniref:UspA domain-containing protein n=1 Tax=candidate division MSBL1 archaeon SCGC-AAA259E22 TaxID=1698265 RepID=A0A133UDD9_9EURY|nr:hypothetical protein AKJ66_04545 [candidate division MSBL1 archaeon SCGC-AAA259E22]
MENRMGKEKKVERLLVPYVEDKFPEKAEEKSFERLKKGGKLFLLHITDEAMARSIRYRTGQLGEKSEILKTFKNTQEKIQKEIAKEHAEKVKKKASKHGISIKPLYVVGNPAEEVLEAADRYSVELILVERLREKVLEVLLGDGMGYIREKAPCRILTVS